MKRGKMNKKLRYILATSISVLAMSSEIISNAVAGPTEIDEAAKTLRRFLPLNTSTAAGQGYNIGQFVDDFGAKPFLAKIYLGVPVTKGELEDAIFEIEGRTNESMGFSMRSGTPEIEIVSDLKVAPHIQIWRRRGSWGVGSRSGYVDVTLMLDLKNFQMLEITPQEMERVPGVKELLVNKVVPTYLSLMSAGGEASPTREISLKEVSESLFGSTKKVYLSEDYLSAVMKATNQAEEEVMGLKKVLVTSWLAKATGQGGVVTEESFDQAFATVYKKAEKNIFFPVPPSDHYVKKYACPSLLNRGKSIIPSWFTGIFSATH